MRGRDDIDIQRLELFDRAQHRIAEAGHDVHIVAQCLADVRILIGTLIVKHPAGERTVTAKSVAGEQDALLRNIGNHGLGPMDKRNHLEHEAEAPEIHAFPVGYDAYALQPVKGLHHRLGLGADEKLGLRRQSTQYAGGARMIRFHMVHDDIVQLARIDHIAQLIDKRRGVVSGCHIDKRCSLASNQVAVVGDAPLSDRPHAFKQVRGAVIDADPVDARLDLNCRHESSTPKN